MESTSILGNEHFWIRHMLDCLEKVADSAERSGQVDSESASELLHLFESFADGQHQLKEELVLFPQLLKRTNPAQEEELRQLLAEHSGERQLMERIRSNLLGAIHGEPLCVEQFVKMAKAHVELHRRHMAHENEVLLPMADRLLTPAEDSETVAGFERLDAEGHDSAGVPERVRALCKRLSVPVGDTEAA